MPNSIKYIVNHLNKPSSLSSSFNVNTNFKNRKHIRNHSYGQEFSFLPNNAIIRLDNDLANKFLLSTSSSNSKHHSRKNSCDASTTYHVDVNVLAKKLNNQVYRENNEDMLLDEEDIIDEEAIVVSGNEDKSNILRHRRTNSKDIQGIPPVIPENPATPDVEIAQPSLISIEPEKSTEL